MKETFFVLHDERKHISTHQHPKQMEHLLFRAHIERTGSFTLGKGQRPQ